MYRVKKALWACGGSATIPFSSRPEEVQRLSGSENRVVHFESGSNLWARYWRLHNVGAIAVSSAASIPDPLEDATWPQYTGRPRP